MSLSVSSGKTIDSLVAAAFRRPLSSVSAGTPEIVEDEEEDDVEKNLWAEIYHGDITQRHLEEISQELGLIDLCWENVGSVAAK